MNLYSRDFMEMGKMPHECVFGTFERFPDSGKDRFRVRENKNPHLCWTDLPPETKSIALICDDLDAADVDQAEYTSGTVSRDVKRRAHCHWVLIDVPVEVGFIANGEFSDGVFIGGKPGPEALYGSRQGLNEFTQFLAKDPMMSGNYYGYDGPCPPFGADPHRYRFTVYALGERRLSKIQGPFTKEDVLAAAKELILDQASITGCF